MRRDHDRRRRLRLDLQALNRDIVSRYLDSLVQVMRERGASEFVLHLAPSPHVLRLVSDRCLVCFVPAYFAEHLRLARQIDGAGLRLDAEFKMAKRIRCYVETHGVSGKRLKLENPFKCTLACRGVRGLYLAPLTLFTTGETGDAYVQFLVPLLQERRATCENDVAQGLPDFISFDSGPAYCLYALAAVGEVWPQAVYGQDRPPCKTAAASRLHSSLHHDSVSIVSDPPHRRWHWQKALPCEHPDYALFDRCLAFALARISASLPLISRQHLRTEPHVRGCDEDETILRQLAVLVDTQAMLSCVQKASVCTRQRLQNLLRSHDVREHGFFKRVFGCFPPNKVLCSWAEALEANPHPDVAFESYATAADFVSDVHRIAAWFSHPRRSCKAVPRKPLEDGTAPSGSRTTAPLLDGGTAKSFLDMVQEPMLCSLMRCGDSHLRFTEMGLRVPTGTTIVERGFAASSMVMFEKTTRYVTPTTFRRHAMLTTLLLNFSILRGQEMNFLNCSDKRLLMLLEMAWTRLHTAAGLSLSRSARNAETLFRQCVTQNGGDRRCCASGCSRDGTIAAVCSFTFVRV